MRCLSCPFFRPHGHEDYVSIMILLRAVYTLDMFEFKLDK
jgi:hypothetical protein